MKKWRIDFRIIGVENHIIIEAETEEEARKSFARTHRSCFFMSIKQV